MTRTVYQRNSLVIQYQIKLAGAPVPVVTVDEIWFVINHTAGDLVYSLTGGEIVWTDEEEALCEVRIPAADLDLAAPVVCNTSFKLMLADGSQQTLEVTKLQILPDPAASLPA